MWRDRTNLYISYRSSSSHHHHPSKRARFSTSNNLNDDSRQGLLSSPSSDTVIEMDILPPRWSDTTDEVHSLVSQISAKAVLLERLHSKHVLPGFADSQKAEEEGEIERLTSEITAAFHQCQRKIQAIDADGAGRAEAAMAKNVKVALAATVQEESQKFRRKQSAYLKKLRGLSPQQSLDASFRPSSPYPTADTDVAESRSALQQSSLLTSNDAAIQQREREITDIAKGIIELAEIFKELQAMVIDQGTMLDRIDYNVEQLNVHVKAAEKEMNVAQGYQRRTLKRKIIFLLLLIVVGMIILVAMKPRRAEAPPPLPQPKPKEPGGGGEQGEGGGSDGSGSGGDGGKSGGGDRAFRLRRSL